MANAVTAVNDVHEAAGGDAWDEPSPSSSTARLALRPTATNVRRLCHRYLPQTLARIGEKPVAGTHAAPERVIEISADLRSDVVDKIAVNRGPISGIVASPDGRRLMVTNHGDNSVAVIDTRTGAVVNYVAGTAEPFVIAMGGPGHNFAYVSTVSAAYDSISVVDTTAGLVVASHPLALNVRDLAVSPDGKHVYAGRSGVAGADVAVLETATGRVAVIDLLTAPGTTVECLDVSPDGRRLYVGIQRLSANTLLVIDTRAHRVIDAVEVGCSIRDVVVSPDGATVCVGGCDPVRGSAVNVIGTQNNRIVAAIAVGATGGLLTQLALSADGERAFVVNGDAVTVLCMLTHEAIGTITVGAQPSCVVESSQGNLIYVADYSGAVTVVSIAPTTASLVEQMMRDEFIGGPGLRRLAPAGH